MFKAVMLSVASVIAMAGVAYAAQTKVGDVNLKLSGYGTLVGEALDQSNMDGLDSVVGAIDTSLVGAFWIDSDGLEVGGVVALDVDYATNFESSLNDQGSSTILNEAWLYADTPWGRLQVGQQDGVARVMGMRPPSVSGSVRIDNPEVFLLAYPCRMFCDRDNPQWPGSIFSPNGMQLRSDIHSSDVWLKVAYYTPRIRGFQFGVSFTPDGSRDLAPFFGGGDDVRNKQSNVWDFGLNYIGTIGDVDVGASVGYVMGQNELNDSPFIFTDLRDWGAGLTLGYREWTAGVAYRRTNVAGGGPVLHGSFASNVLDGEHTEVWSAGLKYETGPWAFGVDYITETEDLPFTTRQQDGSGLEAAVGYTFNSYLRMTGGYQHFEFSGPRNSCTTDSGGIFFPQCDTQDANVGFIETKFSF
ncbi:MAG: porin [Alphaproteobacteria bacterium]|nr:porin [Alphaproteobacteria bacterium]